MRHGRTPLSWAALALLAPASLAQSFLYLPASQSPATNELPGYRIVPFMQVDSRVQMLYRAAEAGATTFTARSLALRYDGPIPAVGAPGPFTIQRLTVKIGATAVGRPGAVFAANLSQPLTTVFDGQATYLPDPGFASPHPFGAPGGSLEFPFAAPATVSIPADGWLVVEFAIAGNTQAGQAHTMLDGVLGLGGPGAGTTANFGVGCGVSPSAPPAAAASTGSHGLGGVFSVHGTGLGAGAPVFAMVGASDSIGAVGPLPFGVPGTGCSVYTSWELSLPLLADGAGVVPAFAPGSLVPVPNVRRFANTMLYAQLVSFVPGANPPWNLVFSDGRAIQLDAWVDPSPGAFTVSHATSATAPVGDAAAPFAYAMRLAID